jgi:hypothetical protein
VTTPFGDFGAPPDLVAWVALAAAFAVAACVRSRSVRDAVAQVSTTRLVAALALFAALLSAGYVRYYLRGGPRIIDATSYYLQARALAAGHAVFPLSGPSGSFRGRFLLAAPDARSLAVIFPPGYPALLALGFLAGAPLAVGPLLAAALVFATFALALRLFDDRATALLAAAFSTLCAVLRYHTADTMSHGFAALLITLVLWCSFDERTSRAALAGALLGLLAATRPVTAAVGVVLFVAARRPTAPRLATMAVAALVPAALFVFEQRLATGAWFSSADLAYYATADGPPGCFRYGFGAGIGCLVEHGDFVRANLPHGFGALAAAGTTLRRLKMHLADAANTELFAPVLALAVWRAVSHRRARVAALGVVGVVALYAPFYFDGNYPGGGARFFADALPLEHVLLAWALRSFAGGLASLAPALALLGFALHTSYDHRRLADREGGRPMFEPEVVHGAGVRRGLVFVDTDHGFNLGYEPGAASARDAIVVARRRHDAHDRVLWESLGEPPVFDYVYDPSAARATPSVHALAFTQAPAWSRYEAEAEWPPVRVSGGWTSVEYPACASNSRALALHPVSGRLATTIELPAGTPGRFTIRTGWVGAASGNVEVQLATGGHTWEIELPLRAGACGTFDGPRVDLHPYEIITLSTAQEARFDFIEIAPEK